MTAKQWHEFALPVSDETNNLLVADVVIPLVNAANAEDPSVSALFFRDMDRPHLITQLRTSDEHAAALAERFSDLVAGSEPAAIGEAATGPATTVPLAGPVFGGPQLAETTRGFLVAVMPTLSWLAGAAENESLSRSALLERAVDVMAAHLPAVSDSSKLAEEIGTDVPLSFLSFRSHAEAFFVTSRDPDALRIRMDAKYAAVRDRLEPRIGAVFDQVRGTGPAVTDMIESWAATVGQHKQLIARLFHDGEIVAHTQYAQDHLEHRDDFTGSGFHQLAGSSRRLQEYLTSDVSFLSVRLLTSLLYLALHSAGIRLTERYFLCHVLSRSCESLFDVDHLTLLTKITSQDARTSTA